MNIWWIGLVTALLLFQLVAIPGILLRRNDFADVIWAPAFAICALAAVYLGLPEKWNDLDLRAWIVVGFTIVWATRLFTHMSWRNLTKKTEDVRYNNWRKQWGEPALLRSWLQVFVLQPLILYVFITPILYAIAHRQSDLGLLAYLGIAIWLAGFLIESTADEQLRRFKSNPENRGKIMNRGIWSWSRHPNYFGEISLWWGMWLIVIEIPGAWWTVVSPLGVTYLILKVSGVSMLEDLMRQRPGFEEYTKRTSKFFPLPPKQKS